MYALVMNFNESYKFSTLWHFLHVTWIGWYPLHFKRSVKSSGVLFRHYEWCWKILSPVKNPLQKKQCLFIYVLSSDMILASLLYFLAYWWGGGHQGHLFKLILGEKKCIYQGHQFKLNTEFEIGLLILFSFHCLSLIQLFQIFNFKIIMGIETCQVLKLSSESCLDLNTQPVGNQGINIARTIQLYILGRVHRCYTDLRESVGEILDKVLMIM